MKKKIIFSIIIILLVCMNGCGKEAHEKVTDPSQMPDIVFLHDVAYEGNYTCAITFYDRNGNRYFSRDEYVCSLTSRELIEEYAQGKLSDKITLQGTCNVDELLENYNTLLELRNTNFKIVYPEYDVDIIADVEYWYGLYYDEEGELQFLVLHKKNQQGDLETDNEQANDIYRWYMGTFEN